MSAAGPTVQLVPTDEGRPLPVIEIRDPECHKCGTKTFVIFERLPWCRQCFLERVEGT
jgi:hypothetical protein